MPAATREVIKYFAFMTLFSCSLFIGRPTEEIFFANRNLKELILEDEISFETYPFEKVPEERGQERRGRRRWRLCHSVSG